ncbi:MAG: selenocysteine synthase [Bryobacterales bacterium]|nr:selenocysteine synthase [Bryobacterales bacterium]
MPDRRSFIRSLSSIPLVGGLLSSRRALAAPRKRDYFKELGIRPIINAAGTYTALTASLMPPEVVAAWEYGCRHYARLDELHDAVGRRIAELVGCEAAMVTAGAASAITLGTAACLTGKNVRFVRQLPDLSGMKSEVIIQKSHHFGYEHAIRNCGIRFVEVETREDVERLAGDRTAMMFFLNYGEPAGRIKAAEFAELGKKLNIPTFNDCAADVPPAENLSKYLKMGFSLVTFSGGKGLCGPQSAGLLLGQRDLIAAARINGPPNSDTIGRGMKVNKEEMLGMLAAVELYLKRDHAADDREWRRRIGVISRAISTIPTVTAETYVPEIANHVPHLRIRWDEKQLRITHAEAQRKLREGEPSIEPVPGGRGELAIGVWMMQPGDDKIVGRRIREILLSAG